MSQFKLELDETNNKIIATLHFQHRAIIIDIANDKLYTHDKRREKTERLMTTHIMKRYQEEYLKEQNKGHRQKVRILEWYHHAYSLQVNVGEDGRVFILIYKATTHAKYRGKPELQVSYHHRRGKGKYLYLQDLKNPIRIWESKYFKKGRT